MSKRVSKKRDSKKKPHSYVSMSYDERAPLLEKYNPGDILCGHIRAPHIRDSKANRVKVSKYIKESESNSENKYFMVGYCVLKDDLCSKEIGVDPIGEDCIVRKEWDSEENIEERRRERERALNERLNYSNKPYKKLIKALNKEKLENFFEEEEINSVKILEEF